MSKKYTIPSPNIESVDLQLKRFIFNINQKLANKIWISKKDFPIIEHIPDSISVSNPILLNYISALQSTNYTAKLEKRGDFATWCLIIKPTYLVHQPSFLDKIFKGEVQDFYT